MNLSGIDESESSDKDELFQTIKELYRVQKHSSYLLDELLTF